MAKRSLETGDIVETVYLNGLEKLSYEMLEALMNHAVNFCIDRKGLVRKSTGIVSPGERSDDDPDYVPRFSYGVNGSPWNSHSEYVEIELPNPADDFEYYQKIRNAMLNELKSRLNTDLRQWRKLAS